MDSDPIWINGLGISYHVWLIGLDQIQVEIRLTAVYMMWHVQILISESNNL